MATADELRAARVHFEEPAQEPESGLFARDWPDARGVFANDTRDYFVWLNQVIACPPETPATPSSSVHLLLGGLGTRS